ncbi:JAB1/Mov34/MPN/PAD-1 ubiquitin protease-domain-containing protein [Radiomyces spectabilis]|uniref:JAB1/Mov34/MPN/PAD-1 ubiquitin protease-domain-containing protein n=1 Tax=Radiomyces spectabilis TaxID=64574 RepID=UPI00221E76B1|nr:JAB1/Mov34/MPN/PAD-1 ubiquitin protease-domain-containing protein [Radiomyces spectabilis]KAI8373188.1 JAB1/Mov34/MPN/PAD-1 ubiquitin protease-domain-containing protein [Radiomyces spectabilis]
MLTKVILPADVYHVMLSHAFTTEKEEIIGMLIGSWQVLPNTNPFCKTRSLAYVEAISILKRSDKRKDRVEIAPEQLHLAALRAEELCSKTNRSLSVIGWYHSHPHITVFPSHIDLRTQLSYQAMDSQFFGIILSCFNRTADDANRVQITCFQSEQKQDQSVTQLNIALEIRPSITPTLGARDTFLEIPKYLYEEQRDEYARSIDRIQYGHRTHMRTDNDTAPEEDHLASNMVKLHNAGIYGQALTRLVDGIVFPATHLLELRSLAIDEEGTNVGDKKMAELEKEKEALLNRPDKPVIYISDDEDEHQRLEDTESFLIDL